MDETTPNVRNYRQMTSDLIRNNKYPFTLGSIILLLFIGSLSARYGNVPSQSVEQSMRQMIAVLQEPVQSREDSQSSLSSTLSDPRINYISPAPPDKSVQTESQLGVATENGQISAISSGQVTYKQNKYILQRGESLATVAEKVYGDRNAWVKIAEANNITNPDYVEVGMELIIPR